MSQCPECGSIILEGKTCQENFYQMLFWEAENPKLGEAHHLMVLSYHLQHPSLYSPEGLSAGLKLLSTFLEDGLSPQAVRKQNRESLDSGKRTWNIKAVPGTHAAYPAQVQWTMTTADVVAGGAENYCDNVRRWAQSILVATRNAGV